MGSSYPKVHTIGHKDIKNLFDGEVYVEEKIDGSQFSMGVINGELCCYSKSKRIKVDKPEAMFANAIATSLELKDKLHPEWMYTCEYLRTTKHNVLQYGRAPQRYLALFDIMVGADEYASYDAKAAEAQRLGIHCVPLLYHGKVTGLDQLKELMKTISVLGATLIEGVVVKNYEQLMFGKLVSRKFVEVDDSWMIRNPTAKDLLRQLIERYSTEARWEKAVQHLKESGELVGATTDIRLLTNEVVTDVKDECEDEIKDILFKYYWKKIRRNITRGLREWYIERLAKQAFK